MDRSEPALIPEWLKGTGGGGAGSGNSVAYHPLSAFQSDDSGVHILCRHRPVLHSQLSVARRGDRESPRNTALTERAFYSSSRSGTSSNGNVHDRLNYDRNGFPHPRTYSRFRRKSSSCGYDELGYDRYVKRGECEKFRTWERQWDSCDRDRFLGASTRDDRGRHYEQSIPPHRFLRSGPAGTSGPESILKQSRHKRSDRIFENDINESGNDLGCVTMIPDTDTLVNSLQKANFERNFPSLGAEERQATVQSHVENSSIFNSVSQPIQHGQLGGSDLVRASTPSSPMRPGSTQGGDGWISALAEAPIAKLDALASINLSTLAQQAAPGSSVSSMPPGLASTSGLNMVEALAQNPTRGRIPQGPSLSEKRKPKSLKSIDSSASGGKVSQPIGLSQHPNSSQRVYARSEFASARQNLLPDQNRVCLLPKNGLVRLEGRPWPYSEDHSLVFEKKKPLLQSQNRSEFFNDLRKKSSSSLPVTGTQDKITVAAGQKADGLNGKLLFGDEGVTGVKLNVSIDSTVNKYDKLVSEVEIGCDEENGSTVNDASLGKIIPSAEGASESHCSLPRNGASVCIASEEEEIAFLRSLGWEESTGEEEALTEEEINSFYQKHMSTINESLRNLGVGMHAGSVASMPSRTIYDS